MGGYKSDKIDKNSIMSKDNSGYKHAPSSIDDGYYEFDYIVDDDDDFDYDIETGLKVNSSNKPLRRASEPDREMTDHEKTPESGRKKGSKIIFPLIGVAAAAALVVSLVFMGSNRIHTEDRRDSEEHLLLSKFESGNSLKRVINNINKKRSTSNITKGSSKGDVIKKSAANPDTSDDSADLAEDPESLADGSEGFADNSEGLADGSEGLADGSEGLAEDSESSSDYPEGIAEESKSLSVDPEGIAEESESSSDYPEGIAEESKSLSVDPEGIAEESKSLSVDPEDLSDNDGSRIAATDVKKTASGSSAKTGIAATVLPSGTLGVSITRSPSGTDKSAENTGSLDSTSAETGTEAAELAASSAESAERKIKSDASDIKKIEKTPKTGDNLPNVNNDSSSRTGDNLPSINKGSSTQTGNDLPSVNNDSSSRTGDNLPSINNGSSTQTGNDLPSVNNGSSTPIPGAVTSTTANTGNTGNTGTTGNTVSSNTIVSGTTPAVSGLNASDNAAAGLNAPKTPLQSVFSNAPDPLGLVVDPKTVEMSLAAFFPAEFSVSKETAAYIAMQSANKAGR